MGTSRVSRVEDRLHAVLEDSLQGRGWVPRVVPYVGYGAPGWIRVLARVVLIPSGGDRPRPADVAAGAPLDVRGWRRFVSASAPRVAVTVTIGDRTHSVESDREGYLDVRLSAELDPGWHRITLEVDGRPPVRAEIRVVGPDTRLGMVSDLSLIHI